MKGCLGILEPGKVALYWNYLELYGDFITEDGILDRECHQSIAASGAVDHITCGVLLERRWETCGWTQETCFMHVRRSGTIGDRQTRGLLINSVLHTWSSRRYHHHSVCTAMSLLMSISCLVYRPSLRRPRDSSVLVNPQYPSYSPEAPSSHPPRNAMLKMQ